MNNSYFSNSFCGLVLLAALIYPLPTVSAYPPNGAEISIVEKRKLLTHQIDSIDLLKQVRKRNGLPIDELEMQQKRIIDTLQQIRIVIQEADAKRSYPLRARHESFLKPQNLFDWIILIVGGIAILSGIMLILGIMKTFSTRSHLKHSHKPRRISEEQESKTSPEKSNTYPKIPSMIDNDSAPLARLRQKITTESLTPFTTRTSLHELQNLSSKQQQPAPMPDNSQNDDLGSGDIKSKVLHAAQSGMDIQEISRQFHISADHVALLLKVAENRSENS